ncbi:asparaginase [Robbsia sp. KACC 23696]|uniref:asparaginase n=1 Tax=Robbsia sp. KACC 23696 TaxID=3149231 RepID=UPI00325B9DF2
MTGIDTQAAPPATSRNRHSPRLPRKPRIVLIGTGGTIAGRGESTTNTSAYDCSVVSITDILAAVPAAADVADITAEQLFQLGSENFGSAELLQLGKRISSLLKRDDVDGVVVTHGTDTLEETAYFLHLTLPSDKPVVLVGAMRPPSSLSADGPLNLFNAILVAGSPLSRRQGTLVVVNDEIHTARDVAKVNTFKLEAFKSPFGPLGYVVEGEVLFYRSVARRHTIISEWSVDDIDTLPSVGIVYAHGGIDAIMLEAVLKSDVKAVIYAATGNGNIAADLIPLLIEARQRGIHVVRASRTGSGVVVRNAAQPDYRFGWLVADDHAPQKARILMMLALSGEQNVAGATARDHSVAGHASSEGHAGDASLQQAFFDY